MIAHESRFAWAYTAGMHELVRQLIPAYGDTHTVSGVRSFHDTGETLESFSASRKSIFQKAAEFLILLRFRSGCCMG